MCAVEAAVINRLAFITSAGSLVDLQSATASLSRSLTITGRLNLCQFSCKADYDMKRTTTAHTSRCSVAQCGVV